MKVAWLSLYIMSKFHLNHYSITFAVVAENEIEMIQISEKEEHNCLDDTVQNIDSVVLGEIEIDRGRFENS